MSGSITTPNQPGQHSLQRLMALLLMIFVDTVAYFLVIPVLLKIFVNDDGQLVSSSMSLSTRHLIYGFAIMLSPLAFLIASPITGHFSDKYGRKKVLFFCLLTALIGFFLPIIGIIKKQIFLILLGRFIAGASTSSQPVAQAAITDFTQGKKRAFYLSLIGFAMTFGMVTGPLAGSYLSDNHLISWFNIMTPYWIGLILSVANIILILLFYQDNDQIKINDLKNSQNTWSHLSHIVSQKSVVLLLFIFLLLEIAWSQYYQAIFLYLPQEFHYSTNQIGLFTAYAGFWMSLGLTIIYRIVINLFSIEKILKVSLIGASLGLIGCSYFTASYLQWIFIIPSALFVGMAYPSILSLISNLSPIEHQGWVLGMASTLLGIAWMVTAILGGLLIDIYLPLPLLLAAGVMLLGSLLIYLLRPTSYEKNDNNTQIFQNIISPYYW